MHSCVFQCVNWLTKEIEIVIVHAEVSSTAMTAVQRKTKREM